MIGWWLGAIALTTLLEAGLFGAIFWIWTIASVGTAILLTVRYPRCPDCGTRLYVRHKSPFLLVSGPWPAKCCAVCGKDLTAAGRPG